MHGLALILFQMPLVKQALGKLGAGGICEKWALEAAVIPAKSLP
jgi:hypothetical protein